MNIQVKKKYTGGVSLLLVLIVSAILIASAITLVLTAIDLQSSNIGIKNKIQAGVLGKTCFEEGLNVIKDDLDYVGTVVYSDGVNTCTSNIIIVSPGVVRITVTSVYDGYTYVEDHTVDTVAFPIDVIE